MPIPQIGDFSGTPKKPLKPFGGAGNTPPPTPLLQSPAIPDYRPVIKALKELVKAFETVQNGGIIPNRTDSQEQRKLKSERAKERFARMTQEERKAHTAKARAIKSKQL